MDDPDTNEPRLVRIALRDVKPNPFRDIERYRLDEKKIRGLVASINSTGFWSNVIGRINEAGEYQLAYGHHRIAAARQVLGDDHVQPFIAQPFTDITMLRMMADENSDSWSNAVEHANLVVWKARDYLDNLLDQYETLYYLSHAQEFLSVTELFKNESQYQQVRRDGVGQGIIQKFLSGTFARGQTVQSALANIPLSPKQRAAKEREAAANRAAVEERRRQQEEEDARIAEEAHKAAEQASKAKAERLKADAAKKAATEAAKKAREQARKAKEKEDRAQRDADRALAKKAENDRKAAEEAQRVALETARKAEQQRKAAEEAEDRAFRQSQQLEKERLDREAKVEADVARMMREEVLLNARLAQDGRYDIQAGESFGIHLHTKTFRDIVVTDRAVEAGISLEDQMRIAQEIKARYGDHLNASTIERHLNRIIDEAHKQDSKNRERREKAEALFERIDRSLRSTTGWMNDLAGQLAYLDEEGPVGFSIGTLHNDLDLFDRARKQLLDAFDARNRKRQPTLRIIDNPKKEP